MPKYAVKVPMAEDDWIFVTRDGVDGLEIVLYDTKAEAEAQAKMWNGKGRVVEYKDQNEI